MRNATGNPYLYIELPPFAALALRTLEARGHQAWCVGECVRDALMGKTPNTFRIATDLPAADAERALADAGFSVRTGDRHAAIFASLQGGTAEVVSLRLGEKRAEAHSGRRSGRVFALEERLAQSDFTIDAIAYHPIRGFVDPHDGMADLDLRTIRVVGDCSEKFAEDAVRILRACRYRAQLGFSIAPSTMQAMKRYKMRVLGASPERITRELEGMLLAPRIHDALLDCVDVLGCILPELAACKGFEHHSPYHIYDVLEHTAWVVQSVPATPLLRWSALFHDLGKPGAFFMEGERAHFYGHPRLSEILARDVMERLSFEPAFKAQVLALVRLHDRTIPATRHDVMHAIESLNGDTALFRALCELKRADALAHSELGKQRLQLALDLTRVLDEIETELQRG